MPQLVKDTIFIMHHVLWSDARTLKIGCNSITKDTWGDEGTCTFRIRCSIGKDNGPMIVKEINMAHCSINCPHMQANNIQRAIEKAQEEDVGESERVVTACAARESILPVVDHENEVEDKDEEEDDIEDDEDDEDDELSRKRLPPLQTLMYAKKRKREDFAVVRGTSPATFMECVLNGTGIEINRRTAERYAEYFRIVLFIYKHLNILLLTLLFLLLLGICKILWGILSMHTLKI
jgi:hypothetical protein